MPAAASPPSQVDRRRGVRVLFECDSVPCDHGFVEGKPGLRAVPIDEFSDGMLFRTADLDCSRSAIEYPDGLIDSRTRPKSFQATR